MLCLSFTWCQDSDTCKVPAMAALWAHGPGQAPAALYSCKGLFVTGGKKVWPLSTRIFSASILCFWLAGSWASRQVGPGPGGAAGAGQGHWRDLEKAHSHGICIIHHLFLALWDLVYRCHICRIPRAQLGRESISQRPVCSLELRAPPLPCHLC